MGSRRPCRRRLPLRGRSPSSGRRSSRNSRGGAGCGRGALRRSSSGCPSTPRRAGSTSRRPCPTSRRPCPRSTWRRRCPPAPFRCRSPRSSRCRARSCPWLRCPGRRPGSCTLTTSRCRRRSRGRPCRCSGRSGSVSETPRPRVHCPRSGCPGRVPGVGVPGVGEPGGDGVARPVVAPDSPVLQRTAGPGRRADPPPGTFGAHAATVQVPNVGSSAPAPAPAAGLALRHDAVDPAVAATVQRRAEDAVAAAVSDAGAAEDGSAPARADTGDPAVPLAPDHHAAGGVEVPVGDAPTTPTLGGGAGAPGSGVDGRVMSGVESRVGSGVGIGVVQRSAVGGAGGSGAGTASGLADGRMPPSLSGAVGTSALAGVVVQRSAGPVDEPIRPVPDGSGPASDVVAAVRGRRAGACRRRAARIDGRGSGSSRPVGGAGALPGLAGGVVQRAVGGPEPASMLAGGTVRAAAGGGGAASGSEGGVPQRSGSPAGGLVRSAAPGVSVLPAGGVVQRSPSGGREGVGRRGAAAAPVRSRSAGPAFGRRCAPRALRTPSGPRPAPRRRASWSRR